MQVLYSIRGACSCATLYKSPTMKEATIEYSIKVELLVWYLVAARLLTTTCTARRKESVMQRNKVTNRALFLVSRQQSVRVAPDKTLALASLLLNFAELTNSTCHLKDTRHNQQSHKALSAVDCTSLGFRAQRGCRFHDTIAYNIPYQHSPPF